MVTAKRIVDRANSFLDALKVLNEHTADLYPLPPKLFILGHSFELLLKAYLTANNIDFKKDHNLVQHLELCSKVRSEDNDMFVEPLGILAQALTPHYSIEVRYPTVDVNKQLVGLLEDYAELSAVEKSQFTPDPQEGYRVVHSLYLNLKAKYGGCST